MEKKHSYYKTLFVLFIVLVSLPGFQERTELFNLKSLSGVKPPAEKPSFTFKGFYTNDYQSKTNDYLNDNFGFREWLIPLYNQYSWDFYKKITNHTLFLGKDNWLWFYEHLADQYQTLTSKFVQSDAEMIDLLEDKARYVYLLQEILKDYGTTLLVCIAPSKNELYPEYLPDNTIFYRNDTTHADAFFVKRFTELGVNFIDLNTLYKSMKPSAGYPLFYKTSSHYSEIAAKYSSDTLIRYIESTSGLNLLNLQFTEPYKGKPTNIDHDMENLINMIRPIEKTDYYYVNADTIPDKTAVRPRILSIGDSFYWNLMSTEVTDKVFSNHPFWYYCKEVYYDDAKTSSDNANYADEVITSDIVMLLWCPINIYDLDKGFVKKAVTALCYDDNFFETTRDKIIKKIKNNPKWYEAVAKQAEEKGENIDDALKSHADYVLVAHSDEYYQSINGYEIPTFSNSRLNQYKDLFKDKTPEELIAIKQMIRNMRDNKELAASIQEKAANNNITFDEQIILDVIWLLDNR